MNVPQLRGTRLAWVGRAVGFLLGGAVGAVLVRALLSRVAETTSPLLPLVAGTAVAVTVVGLPLWRVALGGKHRGRWWGALLAAWIPVGLVAVLGAVSAAVGDLTGGELLGATALLYLSSTPLTAVLAVVGALLEGLLPVTEDPTRR